MTANMLIYDVNIFRNLNVFLQNILPLNILNFVPYYNVKSAHYVKRTQCKACFFFYKLVMCRVFPGQKRSSEVADGHPHTQ